MVSVIFFSADPISGGEVKLSPPTVVGHETWFLRDPESMLGASCSLHLRLA